MRLVALRRFAFAITFLNVLGHFYLGFEQSWAQPLAALAAAYGMELLLEWVDAVAHRRAPRFAASPSALFHFLLPGHITALACAMLLYPNERIAPVVFAVVVAMGAKTLFRAPQRRGGRRHFFNPSNTGIAVTLLCFHWVGIAPPYMFTENLFGWADWLLPAIIVGSGSFLNLKLTRKMPLIAAWLGGFALQATVRSMVYGTPLEAALLPMTGVAFLLFTFYMVTDPATTPAEPARQVVFGLSVAAAYGLLMANHIVFGLFFALFAVCTVRGAMLYTAAWARSRAAARPPLPAPVPASVSGAAARVAAE
ncbi:MAG TPA: enediyne biosynthesis protein UnbU [Thermoanaerobaculia bacterium]|nr:enediyne biosynthesis protein UnbU [Thermoanaerobaculia bacterium]